MKKIGILTFHYSINYGAVLQALALLNVIESLGFDTEIINYIPTDYKPNSIICNLGVSKNIFNNRLEDINIPKIVKKIIIMKRFGEKISFKFDEFRKREMKLSKPVDEVSIFEILNNYDVIVVGSDQVWNPSQRKRNEYFLNFGNRYQGEKISYAADSTTKEIDSEDVNKLKSALGEFKYISVRNTHSLDFVKAIIDKDVPVVADPTILYNFIQSNDKEKRSGEYVLTYILGKEIEGTHKKALERVKKVYGNIPVYSIIIPTMNSDISNIADEKFCDLDPSEWINLFKNAKFIYTDSFHGVLFALKFHKPFIAYYTEKYRATRFIDLGCRYGIENYIVQNVWEIDEKNSLGSKPDFVYIDSVLDSQKKSSIEFLQIALGTLNNN